MILLSANGHAHLTWVPPTPAYYPFPKLEVYLKGDHFAFIDEMHEAVITKLNSISKEEFLKSVKRFLKKIFKFFLRFYSCPNGSSG